MSSESIQSQNKELLKSIELMFETKLIPITKRLTGIEESLCFTTKQLEEKIPELEKKVKNQEKKCDFIEEELKYVSYLAYMYWVTCTFSCVNIRSGSFLVFLNKF